MRKSRLTVLAAIMIAACSGGGNSFAQEKAELRLNLQKGQRFDQVMLVQQKVSQTMMKALRIDATITSRTELQTEVLDVKENGSAELKATYKKVSSRTHMASNIPAFAKEINRKPPADPLTALAGQSFTYIVNSRGQVERIDGLEPLVKRMVDTEPLFAAHRKQLTASFKKSIEEISKQNSGLAMLPAHAVAIGDTWEIEPNVSFSGPVTHQLLARQNGIATISSRSKLYDYPILPALDMPEDINFSFKFSGTDNTLARVDEITGWPRELEINQRLLGKTTATIKQNAGEKQPAVSWPIYMKTTIRIATVTPPQ